MKHLAAQYEKMLQVRPDLAEIHDGQLRWKLAYSHDSGDCWKATTQTGNHFFRSNHDAVAIITAHLLERLPSGATVAKEPDYGLWSVYTQDGGPPLNNSLLDALIAFHTECNGATK